MVRKVSQLQVLCEEKIPRLLNGECPEVVFEKSARSLPKCTEYLRLCNNLCIDYYPAKGTSNTPLCEQDNQPVLFPYCKLRYPHVTQSSPKCTELKIQSPIGDDFGEFLYPQ
jgi:hypothetical protein